MKLFSAILLIFLSSCSSIFWREAKLFPSLSFSETGSKLAYMRVYYQEKDSWNPLDGTTKKKDYTTQIILAEIENDLHLKKITELDRLAFWILPESLFYNEGTGTLAFINGLNANEYGTPNKTVSVYNLKTKKSTDIIKGKSQIKTPLSIALSADATLLGLVSADINENGFYHKFQLTILDLNANSIKSNFPLPNWQDSPVEFELAWSKTEPVLSAHVKEKLFTVKGNTITESKFSDQSFVDNSKYAYSRVYKWESADVDIASVKLRK
jgi:hypothetical protein